MNISKKQLANFLSVKDFFKFKKYLNVLPTSSWLFVTHNRCPFANPEKNPLTWAFQSLINNKFYKVDDFVVVDDDSKDYTKDTVNWLCERYKIKIKYIKNKKRLGCSSSRKLGLKHTKNRLVFMGDDDCLYSEYFLFGSILTYYLLKKKNPREKVAVINFPVYEKNIYPTKTASIKIMGKVFLQKTFFYHEFDCFPLEYIKSPNYLDDSRLILKPIKVDTFKGVNLSDKNFIIEAGNYLDLQMWPSSYSEHIELSHSLKQKGFSMYHQPDPKISCLHLKYGSKTNDYFDRRLYNKKIKGLKYSLGKIVDFSERNKKDSGGRMSVDDFHLIEIGSFFSFYLKISEALGLKFARQQYQRFVEQSKVFSTTPNRVIRNKNRRKKIFILGIKKGIKATEIQTGKNYSLLERRILNELADI